MNKFTVLLKTKGGHKEGMGDVTSSVVLAGEFSRMGHSVLFAINDNEKVIGLVTSQGFKYVITESKFELDNVLCEHYFDIIILNQLDTPETDGRILRDHTSLLVTIEDTGVTARLADVRFNILYPIEDAFTDFAFLPLAQVFQEKYGEVKAIPEKVHAILVTQGGSDTYGFTPKIVQALHGLSSSITVNVVLGPNYSHNDELMAVLKNCPRQFNLIRGLSDLSGLMMEADLAISAGGNTLFELACLGVPTIAICGELFEVQTAERLQREGFGINLGFGQQVCTENITSTVHAVMDDFHLRRAMSSRGRELIDGRGLQTVYEKIVESFSRLNNGKMET